jgi:hypothetical protein
LASLLRILETRVVIPGWKIAIQSVGFLIPPPQANFRFIIGKTALFEPQPSLEESTKSAYIHFFGFHNYFFQSKVVSLAFNPPTWRTRSLYLCHPVTGRPSYTPIRNVRMKRPSTSFQIQCSLLVLEYNTHSESIS